MKCGNCGTENDDSALVCRHCGAALTHPCTHCAAPLLASDTFCATCGQPVPATEADDARLARLNDSAPTALVEKIRATAGSSNRKAVTVLCLSVSGTSADGDWTTLRDQVFDLFAERIYRYEGTIARLFGDHLLAFFGALITHEDDPLRAVNAALEIATAAHEYAEDIARQRDATVTVRSAINTGLILVGKADSDLKYGYDPVGSTVNLAVLLEQVASPLATLVSQESYRYVQPFFECADLGTVALPSAAPPEQIYQIIRPKTGIIHARGIAGMESGFVGRANELVALRQLSAAAQAGLGRVALLIGEPGLGKSRLLSEWRVGQNMRWVEGQCQSFAQGFPYQLVTSLLRSLLGIGDGDAEAALKEQTERLFGADNLDVYPYLANLLGVSLDGAAADRIQQLDPQSLAMQYAEAFRRLLTATTARTPIAAICEDIHWADSSSVELLIKILPVIPVSRMLFCFTSRPDRDVPGWRIVTAAREILGDALTEIQLKPLSEADSQNLLSTLLNSDGLSEQVRKTVRSKAEGNPFFVEELVRTLIEDGTIRREGDQWVSVKDFTSDHVPGNLSGLLVARIDHQPSDVKHALHVASVIGRQFSVRVLAHVLALDDSATLMVRMSKLETASLIQLAQVEPELEYRFRHALLQEASYASLLPDERQALHLAVGRALEALYPDRMNELAAALGHHFAEAEAYDQAMHYFLLAADYAARMYANDEAIAHYTHVLEVCEPTDPVRLRALRERGALFERIGSFEASRTDYEASLAYAQRIEDRPGEWQALIDLGFLWASADYARTGEYFQSAYELAQRLEEPRLVATALNRLANWHMNVEQPQPALEMHRQALELFKQEGDQHGVLETIDLLGMTSMMAGDFMSARRYADQTRELAEQLDVKGLLAQGIAAAALDSMYGDVAVSKPRNTLDEKIRLMQRGLDLVRSMGSRSNIAFFESMFGMLLGRTGNYGEGLRRANEGLALAREIEHEQWQICGLVIKTQIFLEMCAPQQALEYALPALELAQKIGSLYWERNIIALLGLTYIRLDELDKADAVLSEALDFKTPPDSLATRWLWNARIQLDLARGAYETVIERLDAMLEVTPSLDERGEAGILTMSYLRGEALVGLMRQGKGAPAELAPKAEAAYRAAELLAEGYYMKASLWRINTALGELYRFLLRTEDAEREFAKARAIVDQIAATAPNEELRAQLLRGAAEEWSNMLSDLSHRIIKGYQIRETVSKGGFGLVYRAYQPVVDREVAIKVILPQYANQAEFVRRFEAEARLVARLEHPHIVPMYDFWRDEDGAFLVMRFIRGGSLREALNHGGLRFDFIASIAEQVAAALAAAHRQGVIHRDIKPDNILLDEDGNAYLTDFGIAKITGLAKLTADEGLAGSLHYISPEQISSQEVTAQTDIYGLGIVLYEAFAGQHPFANASPGDLIFKHLQDPLPDLSALRPDIPASVNEVLQKATRKEPSERYASAPDFAQALRAALAGAEKLKSPPTNNAQLLDTETQSGAASQGGVTPATPAGGSDDKTHLGA